MQGDRKWYRRILRAQPILQPRANGPDSAQSTTRSVVLYPRGDRTSAFKVLVGRARPGSSSADDLRMVVPLAIDEPTLKLKITARMGEMVEFRMAASLNGALACKRTTISRINSMDKPIPNLPFVSVSRSSQHWP